MLQPYLASLARHLAEQVLWAYSMANAYQHSKRYRPSTIVDQVGSKQAWARTWAMLVVAS